MTKFQKRDGRTNLYLVRDALGNTHESVYLSNSEPSPTQFSFYGDKLLPSFSNKRVTR